MRFIKCACVALAILINFAECQFIKKYHTHSVEIITNSGRLEGNTIRTRDENNMHVFYGIRYAEPPTGEYRFKPPRPIKPWNGIFDASEERPACPQPKGANSTMETSEDCLRLNIYTRQLPIVVGHIPRPVIVFFHPGGFYSFSAQKSQFGPEYLLDKEVVLVTVNYRLGSLGFLSTGDSLIPGNMGLKDQVMALRWIQKNIQYFGGDPDRVTISGYSAGSWSAILHMLSPMSRGLFHRVIAMSGAPTTHSETPKHQKHLVIKQAQVLNCPTATLKDAVDCLMTKPAEDIAGSFDKFNEYFGDPILRWRPVVEDEYPGVERFLTDTPENLIIRGKYAKVPIIVGVDKDEFGGVVTLSLAEKDKGNEVFNDYNRDWYKIAPISFLYERDTNQSRYISDKLKEFYLNNQSVTFENLQGIADIYADSQIIYSAHRFVNLLSKLNLSDIYYYNFIYQGRYSHVYYPNTTKPYGVVHHDELMYIFKLPNFPLFKTSDPENFMVERMTTIFEHFAKYGKPYPENDELFNKTKWEKFTEENKAYLEIDRDLTMKSNLHEKRMSFWDQLFPVNMYYYPNTSKKID